MEAQSFLSRELGTSQLRSPCHMPEGIARKLALETVLQGHEGCVNRLAWNEDGSMLASASDDCQVILWHYSDTGRVPLALQTQHRANLFGVAFLPHHNNTKILSGAMDCTVQLHELESGAFGISPKYRTGSGSSSSSPAAAAAAAAARRQAGQVPRVHHVVPRTTVYHCHKSRVKEVEVCQSEPTMFWSAGEDGTIRQYDTRVPDQKAYGSPNVLIDLTTAGQRQQLVECKGVDVNHIQPHLMAVACSDPYATVFDRRKLTTSRPGGRPSQPLLQLTCPHLPLLLKAGINRRAHTTHVNFSNRGDKLVTSYHGDHAYVFDITGAAEGVPVVLRGQQQQRQRAISRSRSCSPRLQIRDQQIKSGNLGPGSADQITQITAADQTLDRSAADLAAISNLPEAAEASKVSGNNALFEQRYSAAVTDFTAAIAAAPWSAGLYAQRALAYLKRLWEGDAAYALRDCDMALDLVGPRSGGAAAAAAEQQARLRQVHALKQLGQYQCALAALDHYNCLYPPAVDNTELAALEKQLQQQIEQRQTYRAKLRLQRQQMRQRQQQQGQQQQQRSAAAARERYGLQQPDPEQAAAAESQQQQQQVSVGDADPAAAAAAAALDHSGSSRSSWDQSPTGAPELRNPPGPGVRVDTDLDSDNLEDDRSPTAATPAAEVEVLLPPPPPPPQQQQDDCCTFGHAAAAAAVEMDVDNGNGAAAAACQQQAGFIGPVVPPLMRRLQQQQQVVSTAQEAAAAAVTRGRAVSHQIQAAAAAAGNGSNLEVHSVNSEVSDHSDSEDDRELQWLSSETHSESEDELLRPWFGPSTFAQDQIKAAADQQQQQSNGSSSSGSSRRRPHSSSKLGIHIDGDHDATYTNGYHSHSSSQNGKDNKCNNKNSYNNDSYNSSNGWWDSLSGGPGRLLQRCMGHCNVQTDIKEAVFLGDRDELVACGSDDGCVFIYNVATGECVRTLQADDDVANCVRCHPSLPVLATSGIDSVVRLWSPTAQPDYSSPITQVNANQSRMRDGPRLLRGAAIPPAALQAALDENPQLLQILLQQLYGNTAAAAAAVPAAAADDEGLGRGGDQGIGGFEFEFPGPDNSGSGSEGEEGAGRRRRRAHGEVACRVS